MPNYGTLTVEDIKQRKKEFAEQAKAKLAAYDADIARKTARQKSISELKTWMERRKLTVSDLFWMMTQMRPKRADKPVQSKKPLKPPTAHRGGKHGIGKDPRATKPLVLAEGSKADPAFCRAIREKRIERGLNGEEVGDKIGVSGAAISNWEAGRNVPREDRRAAICKFLGLDKDLGQKASLAAMAMNGKRQGQLPLANGATEH